MSPPVDRRALLTAALAGGAAFALSACDSRSVEAYDRRAVEAFIGRRLPDDVFDFHAASMAGIDRIVWVRFDAAEAAALDFARALAGREPSSDALRSIGFRSGGDAPDWWTPDRQPPGAVGIRGRNEPKLHWVNIALAPAGAGRLRVHLEEFET